MQAVIMAGGFGSRLRPLTNEVPKPMVKIINKPILELIIEHLKSYGIFDIIITLGYMPEVITNYFGDGEDFGVNIKYLYEKTPLGTAGGVKQAQRFIKEDFLVLSGDACCNLDLAEFMSSHKALDHLCTIAIKQVKDARGFGLVKVDDKNTIISFEEKPKQKISGLVNMGIYAIKPSLLDIIPKGKYDFSLDLFPKIMGQIGGYESNCYWSDIGTLSSYYLTNNFVAMHPQQFKFFAW